MSKYKKQNFTFIIPEKTEFSPTTYYSHSNRAEIVRKLRKAVAGAAESVPMINSTITNVAYDLVLGPHGLRYKPNIPNRSYNGADIDAQNRMSYAIKRWSRHASIDGSPFIDIEQLVSRSLWMDGECFVVFVGDKIQFVPASQRDLDKTIPEKNIFYGIKYDDLGRPVSYYLGGKVIPAKLVLHIYDVNYTLGNTRIGIPRFSHILKEIDKTNQLSDSVIQQSLFGSSISGFFRSDEPYASDEDDGEDEIISHDLAGAPNTIIDIGDKEFIQAKIETQSESIKTILSHKERLMAKSLGFSKRAIFGDIEGLNYPGLRTVTNDDYIASTRIQELLIAKFYLPVYEHIGRKLLEEGFGPLSTLTHLTDDYERLLGVDIIRPPKPAIDPAREAKALDMDIASGRSTQTQQLAERGMSFDEWARTKKAELETLKKYGLEPANPLDSDLIITEDK